MRLFKNLKARILKSIITWSEMGKQTAQAKEVYSYSWYNTMLDWVHNYQGEWMRRRIEKCLLANIKKDKNLMTLKVI